jgi:hypothetical protein
MSFWLFLSALMAFPRLTLACDITKSTSFSSTPVSSTSSSSDSSCIGATTYKIKFNEELTAHPLALLSPGTSLHE